MKAPPRPDSIGSSPLTRGKRHPGPQDLRRPGLIPAHAGKTPRDKSLIALLAAHPRSRGENSTWKRREVTCVGSSPLTRGKLVRVVAGAGEARLIPAHAGKTPRARSPHRRTKAHPRSRGENVEPTFSRAPLRGSSPLTRGKHLQLPELRRRARLIPAHAGKTNSGVGAGNHAWAHPRSRGENRSQRDHIGHLVGSSPLTRGKLASPLDAVDAGRLIPAHAGKTVEMPVKGKPDAAHPRSRGENCLT